jgi:hypothetical protein
MSDRSVRRMLHEDLHFHPFKIQIVQELIPRDLKQRVQFCKKPFANDRRKSIIRASQKRVRMNLLLGKYVRQSPT